MSRCNTTSTPELVARDCRTWHPADQAFWMDQFDPTRRWEDPVWVRQTQYQNAGVYTRYLACVRAGGAMAPRFVTPKGLQYFIQGAEAAGCTVRTIAGYAWALYKMSALLWPDRDRDWLKQSCEALHKAALRTAKRKITRIPDAAELLVLSDELLARARARQLRDWQATELFRAGLYIRLGIYMPERLRALADLRLAWIDFERRIVDFPAEAIKTKIGRPRELPPHVIALMTEWLSDWREPWMARNGSRRQGTLKPHDSFWIEKGGKPATDSALTASLCKVTAPHFGFPATSHRFRDAAATLHVEQAPDEAYLARLNLGHRSDETLREYVETADQVVAGRAYTEALTAEEEDVRRRLREANARATIALHPRSRRRCRKAA